MGAAIWFFLGGLWVASTAPILTIDEELFRELLKTDELGAFEKPAFFALCTGISGMLTFCFSTHCGEIGDRRLAEIFPPALAPWLLAAALLTIVVYYFLRFRAQLLEARERAKQRERE